MAELRINRDWCKGCEYCIQVCPKDVLGFSEGLNVRGIHYIEAKNIESCTACKLCAIVCPDIVIEVYK